MKKQYVAPAIVAEDLLEQTSLACNATQEYPITVIKGIEEQVIQLAAFAPGLDCTVNVAKGNSFTNKEVINCEFNVEGPEFIVVLS